MLPKAQISALLSHCLLQIATKYPKTGVQNALFCIRFMNWQTSLQPQTEIARIINAFLGRQGIYIRMAFPKLRVPLVSRTIRRTLEIVSHNRGQMLTVEIGY